MKKPRIPTIRHSIRSSTALCVILVWVGARTATFPPSSKASQRIQILDLVNFSNEIGQQLPGSIEQLVFLQRLQQYPNGEIVTQGIIVRQNNPRIRFAYLPPVNDTEIGRDLDMYPPNVDHWTDGICESDMVFSIYEADTHAALEQEIPTI
jgi:hypothetical protein